MNRISIVARSLTGCLIFLLAGQTSTVQSQSEILPLDTDSALQLQVFSSTSGWTVSYREQGLGYLFSSAGGDLTVDVWPYFDQNEDPSIPSWIRERYDNVTATSSERILLDDKSTDRYVFQGYQLIPEVRMPGNYDPSEPAQIVSAEGYMQERYYVTVPGFENRVRIVVEGRANASGNAGREVTDRTTGYQGRALELIRGFRFVFSQNAGGEPPADPGAVTVPPEPEDDFWTVIIGVLTAAMTIAILRALRKRKKKKPTGRDEKIKIERDDPEHYVLELNREVFSLSLEKTASLIARVWKVTSKGKRPVPGAAIKLECREKKLKMNPVRGSGSLTSVLSLEGLPAAPEFSLRVVAEANGRPVSRDVKIVTEMERRIEIVTEPGGKKAIRPGISDGLFCFARVLDSEGNPDDPATRKLDFNRESDWLDLAASPEWREGWMMMYVEASDPNPNRAVSNPPPEARLRVTLNSTDEDLSTVLVITLLDCKLDVDRDVFSFPATREKQAYEFFAFVSGCDGGKPWHFAAQYRDGDDPVPPLSEIAIEQVADNRIKITLAGPSRIPSAGAKQISEYLSIFAQQDDEKPLERKVVVEVRQDGLFLEGGDVNNGAIAFTAKGEIDLDLEFGVYRWDSKTKEIRVDPVLERKIEFNLADKTSKEARNVESVLKPTFAFDDLVTNIPLGRYSFEAPEKIPGRGEIIELLYDVWVEVLADEKTDPEKFRLQLPVKVRTYGVGEDFPDWVKAYQECKYIIDNHVPRGGTAYSNLTRLLEEKKYVLGAEGLNALRRKIWGVAQDLILAEGAEGYKSVDRWATAIETTLEWTQWTGDLAFNAVTATLLGPYAVLANILKGKIISALNAYQNDMTLEDFFWQEVDGIIPFLTSSAQGRLIDPDRLQKLTGSRNSAWFIFVSYHFLLNLLYEKKGVVESIKQVLREVRDELAISWLVGKLQADAQKRGYKVESVSTEARKVIDDVQKAVKINKTTGEAYVDKQKVIEIMQDPQKVRTLKNKAPEALQKAFERTRASIQKLHDAKLKESIARKLGCKPTDIQIDDFRTPGAGDKFNLNTDRDYRMLVRTDGNNWRELPVTVWDDASYKIFGDLTGKPPDVSASDWAGKCQQLATDRWHAEACPDYSDHYIDKETGELVRRQPNIINVKEGKAVLKSPNAIADMYIEKVDAAKRVGLESEAFAQAKKGVDTLKKVRKGYEKMNFEVGDLPPDLQKAMKIIESAPVDADATSKVLNKINTDLKDLNYKDVNAVMQDIGKHFRDLKNVKPKKSYFNKFTDLFS